MTSTVTIPNQTATVSIPEIDNADAFKQWLIPVIEPICQADPEALSKYILALLRKKRLESQFRSDTVEKLKIFINESKIKTTDFVDLLLRCIKEKAYLDPASHRPVTTSVIKKHRKHKSHSRSPRRSRSREREKTRERGGGTRHGGDRHRGDLRERLKRRHSHSPSPERNRSRHYSRDRSPRRHRGDGSLNGKENLERVVTPEGRAAICPSYEQQGFCYDGDRCLFSHPDFVPVEEHQVPSLLSTSQPSEAAPQFCVTMPQSAADVIAAGGFAYQPEYSEPPMPQLQPAPPQMMPSQMPIARPTSNLVPITAGRGARRVQMGAVPPGPPPGPPPQQHHYTEGLESAPPAPPVVTPAPSRPANFEFQPNGNTCQLELRKIPRDMNNVAKLATHFSKFGSIKNIAVGHDDDMGAALISFSNPAEAQAAYRSPEPVFNNRFIKVFWHNAGGGIRDRTGPVRSFDRPEGPVDAADLANSGPRRRQVVSTRRTVRISPAVTEALETLRQNEEAIAAEMGVEPEGLEEKPRVPAALRQKTVKPPPAHLLHVDHVTAQRRKDAMTARRQTMITANQELLSKLLQQQNTLLSKLSKKEISPAVKAEVMKAMKGMKGRIERTKDELKKAIESQLPPPAPPAKEVDPASNAAPKEEEVAVETPAPQPTAAAQNTLLLNCPNPDHEHSLQDVTEHFEKFGPVEVKVPLSGGDYELMYLCAASAEEAMQEGTEFGDCFLQLTWQTVSISQQEQVMTAAAVTKTASATSELDPLSLHDAGAAGDLDYENLSEEEL